MAQSKWHNNGTSCRRIVVVVQILTILMNLLDVGADAKLQLCEVESGQTNIILDMEESRGDLIGQSTSPPELPIVGDTQTEITLELIFPKGNPIFSLSGKTLKLLQPLDRDKDNLSHIIFQVSCTIKSSNKSRNIPIITRISDINDNAPLFTNVPYETTVPENTQIGTTVFRNILAQDKDAGVNGLVEYFLVKDDIDVSELSNSTFAADGFGIFSIQYPHQGQVTVTKALDYERVQRYYLKVIASDRARLSSERLSATTTLIINIVDSDDLDPSFIYRGCVLLDGACIHAEYSATVPSGTLQGILSIHPERIQAIDLDSSISSPIRYSFSSGSPSNFRDYFKIDESSGIVEQIKLIDATVTARQFDVSVKAEEDSDNRRFTTAKLVINVKNKDSFPPVITASAVEGFVYENSPIGTKVLSDMNGNPIQLKTTDADILEISEQPMYSYELTTPSFAVSKDGIILVNELNLDREATEKFRFQIVARETNGNAASSPFSITVNLLDKNDNPPKLAKVAPIQITAGDSKTLITKVMATDSDTGENAIPTYSIYHVSNNGANKFTIDNNTGEIMRSNKLVAGERYSITVQATDIGNLYSQSIVEVTVIPGPNTKPPRFLKSIYEVQVSEGADINSTVVVVKAEDPESDPVRYVIISGNDLRQFSVASDSGVITLIRKLDREELNRYQLIIRADDNGGLSSSATVNIKVSDVNDKNPEFSESAMPFVFTVLEGKANVTVGTVHATDADEGINAVITYSIPDDLPLVIDDKSGVITTRGELDYEKQKEYKFVVTAKDGAPDNRLGTATVTVIVKDVQDEVPKFIEPHIEVHIPENVPDMIVATVVAIDPDTIPEITYVFKNGNSDLFKIDHKTGVIKTIRGLDYEEEAIQELIVGTAENVGRNAGDIIKVKIIVEDRNDVVPVFLSIPEPASVNDDEPIGTKIASMLAVDGDGTAPSNTIRYEMVGRGKAQKYFSVDPDNGDVRLRNELRREEDTEYQVDVRAFDLGEPPLSSVASLPVYVKHVLTDPNNDSVESKFDTKTVMNPEAVGLAFSDNSYTTSVVETTEIYSIIKLIQIINSKKAIKNKSGFKCEIVSGNELSIFDATIEDHTCGVVLLKPLDYENRTSYELGIKLISTKYFVNPQRSFCKLNIIVQDQNDNAPVFKFTSPFSNVMRNDTFYGVVNADADIDTTVINVKADDFDSGTFGMINYRIYDDNDATNSLTKDEMPSTYFTIVNDTGVLKIQKSLHAIKEHPIKLIVEARDNNGDENGIVHRTTARIVVNLLSEKNRMTMFFSDANPKDIRRHGKALEMLLLELSSGLITRIEKFSNRRSLIVNGSIIESSEATDVWFYAINPVSEKILDRDDEEVYKKILQPAVQSQIITAAAGITKSKASGIFGPVEAKQQIHKVKAAVIFDEDIFPITLIAIAVIILVSGLIGIIYICISWSKYKNFKQRMRHYPAPANTMRYDPVILSSPTGEMSQDNLKEYETQILAMAVNADEQESDLQMEYGSKNHAFNLDNVSYITHKENGNHSPTNSDTPTAVMIGTQQRNNHFNLMNNINNKRFNTNKTIEMNHRNNYVNPLSMDGNMLPGTTLTLGRIKSERNQIINGYGDNRNNLTMAQNNTFSTLGRNTRNQMNNGRIQNNYVNNNNHNTLNRNHRYAVELPINNPLHNRHQSNSNTNVYFGGKRGSDYYLDFPYDQSDETTTEL